MSEGPAETALITPHNLEKEIDTWLRGKESADSFAYRMFQAGCEYMRELIANMAAESGDEEAAEHIRSIPFTLKDDKNHE